MGSVVLREEGFEAGYEKATELGLYIPQVKIAPQEDISFSVYREDALVIHVPCFIVDKSAGWHDGTSSVPVFSPRETPDTMSEAVRLVVEQFGNILQRPDVSQVKVLCSEHLPESAFSHFSVIDNSRFYGYIDLELPFEDTWRNLRESYQSLINKGRRSFERQIYSSPAQVPQAVLDLLRNSRGMTDETYFGMLYRLTQTASAIFAYFFRGEIAGAIEVHLWDKFSQRGDILYNVAAYNYLLNIPKQFCVFDAGMYFKGKPFRNRYFVMNASRCNRDLSDENQAKLAKVDFFQRGFCTTVFTREYKIFRMADQS